MDRSRLMRFSGAGSSSQRPAQLPQDNVAHNPLRATATETGQSNLQFPVVVPGEEQMAFDPSTFSMPDYDLPFSTLNSASVPGAVAGTCTYNAPPQGLFQPYPMDLESSIPAADSQSCAMPIIDAPYGIITNKEAKSNPLRASTSASRKMAVQVPSNRRRSPHTLHSKEIMKRRREKRRAAAAATTAARTAMSRQISLPIENDAMPDKAAQKKIRTRLNLERYRNKKKAREEMLDEERCSLEIENAKMKQLLRSAETSGLLRLLKF